MRECAEKWKAGIKVSLEEKINRGQRFSASLDEYTSKAHSRYMNINLHLHSGDPIGLGMIRVRGSLPADRAAQMVNDKLKEFGLSEECHIVAVVTDGAAVMVKMHEHFEAFEQLCFAHGIHLAVCDLLYEKKRKKKKASAGTRASDVFQTLSGTESEQDDDDDTSEGSGNESDTEEPDQSNWSFEDVDTGPIVFLPDVEVIIKKVRSIVKIFTSSPNNNNILQEEVMKLKKKELKLIRDCKTRWVRI